MEQHTSLLKFYRDLRIPVKSRNININVEALSGSRERKGPIFEDANIINISTTGLGFESYISFELNQNVLINLTYKKKNYELMGRIVRVDSKRDIPLYGVKVDTESLPVIYEFVKSFLLKISSHDLRDLLCKLLFEDSKLTLPGRSDQLSIISSIFTEFHKYSSIKNFKRIILNEFSRIIGCDLLNFYYKNIKEDTLELIYPGANDDIASLKFKYKKNSKLLEKMYTNGTRVMDTFSAGGCGDPFYSEIEKTYGVDIRQVLAIPIKNHKNNVVGHIEIINKLGGELFSSNDENLLNLVSLMMNFFIHDVRQHSVNANSKEILKKSRRKFAIVGHSLAAKEMRNFIRENKEIIQNVHLMGEYGTGKNILAKVIHFEGPLGKMPCGEEDCAEITSNEELKDIFKGNQNKVGKFELYSGGSIILKNIDSLAAHLQVTLLDLLVKQKDIRIISTASTNVELMVSRGEFHKDLFSFLSQHSIVLRPLRERKDDIESLIDYFIVDICDTRGFLLKSFSPEIIRCFKEYEWKENVEELRVAVERAVLYNMSSHQIKELPYDVTPWFDIHHAQLSTYRKYMKKYKDSLRHLPIEDQVNLFEFMLVSQKLSFNKGDKKLTAKSLGLTSLELSEIIEHGEEIMSVINLSQVS